MTTSSKKIVKTEEENFWDNIKNFLTKYNVQNELWVAREGHIKDLEIGKYQTKFFVQLNILEHEEAIKHLKKNGWKAERNKYDRFGNDIYDEDIIILSYTPYNFL